MHFFMPTIILFGFCLLGSFALHRTFFKFGGCLKATMGGSGKILDNLGSRVIDFQCFLIIPDTLGNFELYVTAQVTLFVGFLSTLFRASCLSMSKALLIASLIIFLVIFS